MRFKSITKTLLSAIVLLIVSLNAYTQNRTITGKVLDATNQGIIGAGVLAVGTTNGTMTDIDGNFSISVPKGTVLNISCIGYVSQDITISDQTSLTVILIEDSEMLEETVVIGYGVQRKSDVTGAIASVKSTDLDNRSTSNALSAIQGKAAGVQIINNSGAPGQAATIQIRGYSSNTTNSPLMIVDGLKVSSIDFLDPSNIASMEILKDAASAAIYGIEAGNGVVLITTKSGASQNGKGLVTYSYQNTTERIKPYKLMNAKEYMDYQMAIGMHEEAEYEWDGKTDTDWIAKMTEPGRMNRHTVGFQGKNDKGSLFVSFTSLDNNGIIAGDHDVYKRLSGQINADYQINKWIQVGVTTSLEKRYATEVSEGVTSVLGGMLSVAPIVPYIYDSNNLPARIQRYVDQDKPLLRDPNGNIYGLANIVAGSHNPVIMRERSEVTNNGFNLRGTAFVNLTPFKGFTFTSRFGYRTGYSNRHTYSPQVFISDKLTENFSMSETTSNNFYYQWENFANYMFKIGKSNFTAMAGMSFQHSESNNITVNADELSDYAPNFRYLSSVVNTAGLKVSGQPNETANLSFFARLGWNYDNRYNLQASFRADAYDSSKLEKNHRWGFFPSVSAGWTISNEEWMSNIASALDLSSLKLRASWGINGNVNALGSYQYASTLTNLQSAGYDFNNKFITGVSPLQPGAGWWSPSTVIVPNPEVKWETSHQVDVGLDARFFSNRLSIGLDWFNKNTMDLLTSTTPPANTGGTTMYVNAGKVNNTGFEIELDWKDSIGDFTYGVSANAAFLKNEVIESIDIQKVAGAAIHTSYTVTYLDKGYPLWYIGAFQMESIDQQTGAATYTDVNKDGKLDQEDQIYSGKGIPDMTYGFTLNFAYKGFDFIINGAGVQGVDKLFCVFRGDNPETNKPKSFYDRTWKNPQSTGYSLPKPSPLDPYLAASTAMIYDGSFLKIKQMQLGYNLPKNLVKKIALSNIRLYVSLDDWFTFTKYPGLDPETTGTGSRLAVDSGAYPISKKTVFGINVAF